MTAPSAPPSPSQRRLERHPQVGQRYAKASQQLGGERPVRDADAHRRARLLERGAAHLALQQIRRSDLHAPARTPQDAAGTQIELLGAARLERLV